MIFLTTCLKTSCLFSLTGPTQPSRAPRRRQTQGPHKGGNRATALLPLQRRIETGRHGADVVCGVHVRLRTTPVAKGVAMQS